MKMIHVMVMIMIMRPTKKFMTTMIMEVIRIMILSDADGVNTIVVFFFRFLQLRLVESGLRRGLVLIHDDHDHHDRHNDNHANDGDHQKHGDHHVDDQVVPLPGLPGHSTLFFHHTKQFSSGGRSYICI